MNVQQVWDGSLLDLLPPAITSVLGVNTLIFPQRMTEFTIVNGSGATIYVAHDGQEQLSGAPVTGVTTMARTSTRRSTVTVADYAIAAGASYTRKVEFKTLYVRMAAGVKINDFTTPTAGVYIMARRDGVAQGM